MSKLNPFHSSVAKYSVRDGHFNFMVINSKAKPKKEICNSTLRQSVTAKKRYRATFVTSCVECELLRYIVVRVKLVHFSIGVCTLFILLIPLHYSTRFACWTFVKG